MAVAQASHEKPKIHVSDLAPPAKKPRKTPVYATPEERAKRALLHDHRVEYVADMMRALTFRTGATAKSLAVEWGMPLSYVAKMTAEASRKVRKEYDEDRVMSKIAVALDTVIDRALESGDRHAIIKAVQVWAHVTGAGAPTRIAVSQDLSALTPAQLQARKAEIIQRLTGRAIDVPALPEASEIDGEG